MATNDSNNEWVKEGTPREDWDTDTDYGVEIHPTEWDDYSDEQAVPVPTPPAAREEYDRQAEAPQQEGQAESSDEGALADEDAPESQPTADVENDGGWSEPVIAPGPLGDQEGHPAEESTADLTHEDVADGEPLSDETDVEATEIRERPIVPDSVDEPALSDDVTAEDSGEPVDPEGDAVVLDEESDAVAADDEVDEEKTGLMEKPFTTADDDESFRPEGSAAAGAGATAAGAAGLASLYRQDDETQEVPTQASEPQAEQTKQLDQSKLAEEQAEEEARLAKLREQRDERDARLGVKPQSTTDGTRVITKPVKRQSDKFLGAFSLFVLRLVTASIIGVLGYQVLSDVDAASQFLGQTVIPEPRLVSWILGFGLVGMAALLVLGLGTRLVGFLLLAVAVASLALIRWGQFSIFQDGLEGFLGDRTLLTAAVGLILTAFGAGRWSIDGAIRNAREKSKAAKSQ